MQYFPDAAQTASPKELVAAPPPNSAPAQPAEEENTGGNKIGEILEVLRRRALIIAGVATFIILQNAWKLSQQPTIYFGNFRLLVEPVNADLAALSDPNSRSNSNRALDYDTQLAILKSPGLIEPAYESLQKDFPSLTPDRLLGSLEIKQLGTTKIIEISFSSNNQAQTSAVLEALADTYLEYSLNERQTYLRQGLQFVDRQLKTLQTQVDDLQDQLQTFRQSSGFFQPEDRSAQLTEQLGALETNRLALEQQLFTLRSNLETLQTPAGIQSLVAVDEGYQALLTQIREIDTQINTERIRFQDENIVIQSLLQKRQNLLPLLQQQANTVLQAKLAEGQVQIQQIEAQLQNVANTRARVEAEMRQLPQLTRKYENLNRQLNIAVNSLTGFLESRQSLQIQAAQSEIPWELVREPFSVPQPSNFSKALLNKIVMGFAAGIAIAFALDKIDGTFHTVSALKRKIKLPILGILPFNQQVFLAQESSSKGQQKKRKLINQMKQALLTLSQQFSTGTNKLAIALFEEYDGTVEFFESLRVIHTNIQHMSGNPPKQVFIVTSAMVGDGKTTFAINWADTAAVMGNKVLLIDANFRKPEIHEFLNLDNHEGLNTLMENTHINPMSLVQRVFAGKEFYILSAGPIHPIQSMILNPQRLYQITEQLRQEFDLIIFDVPSILGLADGVLLSHCADALIMVASLHQTPQTVIQDTLDELEQKNIPVLGLVINRQKGAEPVLRATISQSTTMNYFPQVTEVQLATEPSNDRRYFEDNFADVPTSEPETEKHFS